MPTKYKTIFFDVGSTLIGLVPSWEGVYHKVFQKAGYHLPIGEVEQAVAYSWNIVGQQDPTAEFERTLEANRRWQREVEMRVLEYLKIEEPAREELFWQIIKAFEDTEAYALYPEVLPVLQALQKAGYRLGIISNWSWHLPELCEQMGFAHYFDYIAASARVGYAKPRREIFADALQGMQADPASSLHIGDNWTADVLGARQLGIAALWLDRTGNQLYPPDPNLHAPERQAVRITSLTDIFSFLEG